MIVCILRLIKKLTVNTLFRAVVNRRVVIDICRDKDLISAGMSVPNFVKIWNSWKERKCGWICVAEWKDGGIKVSGILVGSKAVGELICLSLNYITKINSNLLKIKCFRADCENIIIYIYNFLWRETVIHMSVIAALRKSTHLWNCHTTRSLHPTPFVVVFMGAKVSYMRLWSLLWWIPYIFKIATQRGFCIHQRFILFSWV